MVRQRFLLPALLLLTVLGTLRAAFPAAADDLHRVLGVVFYDVNQNGVREPGEVGLAGVQMRISTHDWHFIGFSQEQGLYEFAGLTPAKYRIELTVPAGYVATTPVSIIVDAEKDRELRDVNFGLITVQLAQPTPVEAVGEVPAEVDFAIGGGHFYKQANGRGGAGETGFGVVDGGTDGQGNVIKMWSGLQGLGGVQRLGYPITRRFRFSAADPFTYQGFQMGLLQWDPASQGVRLANLMDMLHDAGLDPLLGLWGYPPWQTDSSQGDYPRARAERLAWLEDPAAADFKAFYLGSAVDAETFYGLPSALPRTTGWIRAMRFQRAVLASYNEGPVQLVSIGEDAKRAEFLKGDAVVPHRPGEIDPTISLILGASSLVPAPILPLHKMQYRVEWVEGKPNCQNTVLRGVIRDAVGLPRSDELVRTWNDWGNEDFDLAGHNKDDGDWGRLIGDGIRPGVWHAVIVDKHTHELKSEVSTIAFTEGCGPGGVQEVIIHFRENPNVGP